MELQKVFQEVHRKLAYYSQHLSKKSLNGFGRVFCLVVVVCCFFKGCVFCCLGFLEGVVCLGGVCLGFFLFGWGFLNSFKAFICMYKY